MILKHTIIACAILIPHLLSAAPDNTQSQENKNELATFYTFKGNIEKAYNTLVEKKLSSIGFNLTDPHKRVNDQYEVKWGSTVLDVLSFMPLVRDSTILPLLNIDPRIAGFAPFNLVIHKKLDENITHVGHLTPKVMLDILHIDNTDVRRKFSTTFKALDATISQELGGTVSTIHYKKLPQKTMINYEYHFETPEDMDDFIDEFQNTFELAFIDAGYLIAGYHNFMEATPDAEEILSDYSAFWTYSLCHLEFSYNMFDTKGARPEAGLFAPCTMYMYIRKGTNTLVVGMFRLHNWTDTLDITDEKRVKLVDKLDTEIPSILEKIGMKSVPNVNPLLSPHDLKISKPIASEHIQKSSKKTIESNIKQDSKSKNKVQQIQVAGKIVNITIPSVPKAIILDSNLSVSTNRNITFSKRVPPDYIPHGFDKSLKSKELKNTRIGEVNKGKIAAYLRGDYIDVETLKQKLIQSGFEIVSTTAVNKKEDLVSIVFSNAELITLANKPNRGFLASLRALVDIKEKTISITNPLYMAKGFLQDDFDEKIAKKVLIRLLEAFPKLTNSKDSLKYQLLPKYQFMNGMPKYQDMVEVASGSNLLEKIKNNKKVVFSQTLTNGATLIGIQLGKRTRKFTKRIGRNNAAMLPYPILIEDGKAKILDPKFYISYMYPMLTMSEFMTIATIPDAMVKDCEKVFK